MELAERLGLQPAPERDAAGGPLLDEEESVLAKFERLRLVLGPGEDAGEGTLFITEWRVFWLSSADAARGYSVDFPSVAMHAVATDEESGNRPCLYLQLDAGEEEGGLGAAAASGSDDEGGSEGEAPLPELRLVPADPAQLEPLFQAFCEGAERNPDDGSDSDDGEGGGFFYDEDAALAGAAAAALGVGDVEELVGADPGRFADPEDDEDGFEEFEGQAAPSAPGAQPNGGC